MSFMRAPAPPPLTLGAGVWKWERMLSFVDHFLIPYEAPLSRAKNSFEKVIFVLKSPSL